MFRNIRIVYVTTGNKEEARTIGKALVEEKLAACANIVGGIESIYRWKDNLETANEYILILKTTYSNITRLTSRIKELHSYDVPCVITVNVSEQEGNPDYLDWIQESVLSPLSPDEKLISE